LFVVTRAGRGASTASYGITERYCKKGNEDENVAGTVCDAERRKKLVWAREGWRARIEKDGAKLEAVTCVGVALLYSE
jgi:hypothetical protein